MPYGIQQRIIAYIKFLIYLYILFTCVYMVLVNQYIYQTGKYSECTRSHKLFWQITDGGFDFVVIFFRRKKEHMSIEQNYIYIYFKTLSMCVCICIIYTLYMYFWVAIQNGSQKIDMQWLAEFVVTSWIFERKKIPFQYLW